jgi:hypothetical protein
MKHNKDIVVFIRSHNDLDHVIPILYHFVLNERRSVKIFGIGTEYQKYTTHINFIKKKLSLEVINFESYAYSNTCWYIDKVIKNTRKYKKIFSGRSLFFLNIIDNNILLFLQNIISICIRKFVYSYRKDTVFLADFGTENKFPYSKILKNANKNNIPINAYLHGYSIFTNLDPVKRHTSKYPYWLIKFFAYVQGRRKSKSYDRYLVGAKQKNTYFISNMYKNFESRNLYKVYDIGVPRFTYEWADIFLKKNKNTSKALALNENKKNFNVVLFLSNPKFNVNLKNLEDMIKALRNHAGINFILKPHTRSGQYSTDYYKGLINGLNIESSKLIEWSDVCLVFGTSIALNVIMSKKILVVPTFIDSNKTIFEENRVCVAINSINDLIRFLQQPLQTYESNDVDKFIQKYIYGNHESLNSMLEEFSSTLFQGKN